MLLASMSKPRTNIWTVIAWVALVSVCPVVDVAAEPAGSQSLVDPDYLHMQMILKRMSGTGVPDVNAMVILRSQLLQSIKGCGCSMPVDDTQHLLATVHTKELTAAARLRNLALHYNRGGEMFRASHILLAIPTDAPLSIIEQRKAYALDLRHRIIAGKLSFEQAVLIASDDPTATDTGGDLGYFSVFEQIYPLETAVVVTSVGEISMPVRTRFGYHLIKPTERISIPTVKRAAHVMIAHDTANAEALIEEAHHKSSSVKFSRLVKLYSQDLRTRNKAGDLGTDRLLNELESVRLQLAVGEVSVPIESVVGWHILRISDEESRPSFAESVDAMTQMMNMEGRELMLNNALTSRDSLHPVVAELAAFYRGNQSIAQCVSAVLHVPLPVSSESLFLLLRRNRVALEQFLNNANLCASCQRD